MRIGSVSGIAGRRDSSLNRPVPDAETLPILKKLQLSTVRFTIEKPTGIATKGYGTYV